MTAPVCIDMAMSLDGFVAPRDHDDGSLHRWFFAPDSAERALIAESIATTGAIIIGRRTYDLGVAHNGFANNPYDVAHIVLTHTTPTEPASGTEQFTFVADVGQALKLAREAAGDRSVVVGGGAQVARHFLSHGLIDELYLHVAPLLLKDGLPLFAGVDLGRDSLHQIAALQTINATHLRYRVQF